MMYRLAAAVSVFTTCAIALLDSTCVVTRFVGGWPSSAVFTSPITFTFEGDYGAAGEALLCNPTGIALDRTGNLFIADRCNSRVRKVSPDGTITTVAGTSYNSRTSGNTLSVTASLDQPQAVAADENGN